MEGRIRQGSLEIKRKPDGEWVEIYCVRSDSLCGEYCPFFDTAFIPNNGSDWFFRNADDEVKNGSRVLMTCRGALVFDKLTVEKGH